MSISDGGVFRRLSYLNIYNLRESANLSDLVEIYNIPFVHVMKKQRVAIIGPRR